MTVLEPAAGRFGRLAVRDIGEQQDESEHAVRRRKNRIAAHEHGAGPRRCALNL